MSTPPINRPTSRRQAGVTTVEFAIIGVVLIVVLFAVIEFGRALFIMNTLTEATRRGVRVAVVCPVDDPAVAQTAVFDGGSGQSTVVSGLSTDNIMLEYLDAEGGVIDDPEDNFFQIRYARVSVMGFTHDLVIPLVLPSIPMNGFAATLPRESLGIPREGTVEAC